MIVLLCIVSSIVGYRRAQGSGFGPVLFTLCYGRCESRKLVIVFVFKVDCDVDISSSHFLVDGLWMKCFVELISEGFFSV
ncbi:hypothetical protein E2C01_082952 [Portunus trituberculatus]|uniref:Secreted protein n=1 Tax=Portunus trituberculatus TaxID=210409 RepID=A0A5B7IVW9_PORTR|nr:hypothetical protein [Portunus trituberculatus]